MAKKKEPKKEQLIGFLGVGLDHADGEHRITRSEHFFLIGGSQETHERMQDTVIRFDEDLRRQGKTLRETSVEEAIDILRRSAQ